jgi:dihydrofolate reductase
MIHAIVCVAADGTIGVNGDLPWHIPTDLRRFKEITSGKTVVMGRKTFDSIGRPLPNRKNVIVSRSGDLSIIDCQVISDVSELNPTDDVFIIGGVEIYELFRDDIDKWHVTHVLGNYGGDARLSLDLSGFFQVDESEVIRENGHAFTFSTYIR